MNPDQPTEDDAVESAIEFIAGVIIEATEVDERVHGYQLPLNAELRSDIEVEFAANSGDTYGAMISVGRTPAGSTTFAWPMQPDRGTVAYVLNYLLLLLRGGDRSKFDLRRGSSGLASFLDLSTHHNGFSSLRMQYVEGERFWDAARLAAPTASVASGDSATRVEPATDLGGGDLSIESYQEAVLEAALEFTRKVSEHLDVSDEFAAVLGREVACLYLSAIKANFEKLASDENFDWVVEEIAAYCGGGLLAGDDPEIEDIDRASAEMELALAGRYREYSDLALSKPFGRSQDLGRRFALRLRAELGGREEIETLGIKLFSDLPDLSPEAVVRRFLDEGAR